jgi:DoxX-like family
MSPKAKKIIGWILTGLVALVMIFSAVAKLTASEQVLKTAASFGLPESTFKSVGILEIFCIVLFIIPRTGVLGTLLVSAYIGGAIATHLEHQLPFFPPAIVECIVWIAAVLRFPELSTRLMGGSVQV